METPFNNVFTKSINNFLQFQVSVDQFLVFFVTVLWPEVEETKRC